MYKELVGLVVAIAGAASLWMFSATEAPGRADSLEVSRYTSVTLSESRADAILAAATSVLRPRIPLVTRRAI